MTSYRSKGESHSRSRPKSGDVVSDETGNSGSAKSGKSRSVQLFDKEGLKARKAADQVLRLGPLRWGMDGRFWAYRAGVYVPGDDVVHARIVGVLGDRYRPAHGNAKLPVAHDLLA